MMFSKLISSAAVLFIFAHPLLSSAAPTVDEVTKAQWIEVSSENFRVVTERPEKVARQMVIDLESLRYISNRLRGATSLEGPPLTIVAVGQDGAEALQLPKTFGGAFELSRRGYAAIGTVADSWFLSGQIANSRSVFLHEYHHFLLGYSPESTAYPLWYSEGMAEYWSSMNIEDGKVWFGDPSRDYERERNVVGRYGRTNFDTRFLFSRTSLKGDKSSTDKEQNDRIFSQARYAIHYFNSSPELRRQLAHYLRLYNMGLTQDQAVRIAFEQNYLELDAALGDYVAKGVVRRGFDIGPDGLNLPRFAVKVTPLDRAAVLAVLADVIPRFIPADSATTKQLLAANLTVNLDDPNAHAVDLELALGHIPAQEAQEKVEGLERRFPNHPRLMALHADILVSAAARARASGAKGWEASVEQARGLYRKSIAASPFNPRAFTGLANIYAALPELEPADEGIAALDTAVIYEHQPRLFRALAEFYLRKKQLRSALLTMRNAVAFNTREQRPYDVLLLENLELLMDLTQATPTETGLSFKSGAIYTGPVVDGKPEGSGTWRRLDGSSYTGEFKAGLPSGHGTLRSERGDAYDGSFKNGYASGTGSMIFAPGKMKSYSGEVVNATPNGKGVLETRDGRVATTFRNGVPIGGGPATPARPAAGAAQTGAQPM